MTETFDCLRDVAHNVMHKTTAELILEELLADCLEPDAGRLAHIDPFTCTLYDLGLHEAQLKAFVVAVNSCCRKNGKQFELTTDMCITNPSLGSIAYAIDASPPSKSVKPSARFAGSGRSAVLPIKAVALLFLGSLSAAAAQSAGQCNLTEPVRSTFWTTVSHGTYRVITASACAGQKYVLYDRGTTAPSLGTDYLYFAVPLQKAVATTTISLRFLEVLAPLCVWHAAPLPTLASSRSPCRRAFSRH